MNNSTFRTDFPEFTSIVIYPETQLTFWGNIAEKMVNECRWGDMKPFGVELFVAHQLCIMKMNVDASNAGGTPGQNLGAATSKSVGEVSVGYDANVSMEVNAGHWNLTTYGKQFIRLLRMFGMGAVQL